MSTRNKYPTRCNQCRVSLDPGEAIITGSPTPYPYCEDCLPEEREGSVILEDCMAAQDKAPFPYQRTGGLWFWRPGNDLGNGTILADGMGLGKTIQALMALPVAARVVVVCPAVAKGVWANHLAMYRPDYKIIRTIWKREGDLSFHVPKGPAVTITNFELLPKWLDPIGEYGITRGTMRNAPADILKVPMFVVVDEAHYAKNPKSARTRRTRALCALARKSGGVSWCLTGTPLKNRPPDLYSLLQVAGLTGRTWPVFKDFARDMGGYRRSVGGGRKAYFWDGDVAPHVPQILKLVMLRREKQDVMHELPPKRWERVTLPIPGRAKREADKAIAALWKAGVDLGEATVESIKNAAEMPGFEELSRAFRSLAIAKVPGVLGYLDDYAAGGGKAPLVWSRHVAPLVAIHDDRDGWGILTGSKGDHSTVETQFQRGDFKGLCLSIRAAMTALTLTATDRAFFIDREWSPTDNEQAEDRIHRIGQFNPCIYTIFVADHALDLRLDELLDEKSATVHAAISAARVRY